MKRTILAAITLLLAITLQAQKRVNNRLYNPDPAPVVSGDRLYVFTGHDLDTATYFRMPDWQVFSTTDMEHWTDHGIVMTTANFKWAKQGDNAWASQAIERNGKWYWYVAAEDTTKHLHGIGVAVADRPEGPWTDPIGKPLIPGSFGFIDPTVFIDDDGQAWLFWGNNGCWYAKLNEDMISIDTSFANNGICDMRAMLDDEAQFGPKCMKMDYQLHKKVMKTGFEEAPWLYKIGDTYFLEYAAGGVPEHWAYSTAKSIHGPWHYEGRITDESPGSFTIHGGTIDFKGKSYLFYHDGVPSGGNGFRRTTAFREFQRMKDGRIPKIDIEAKIYNQVNDIPYREAAEGYAQERCKLDVYYPTNETDAPVVVWFHGGGIEGGEKHIDPQLKNSGLVVVAANYRLLPKAPIDDILDDAAAAVAWTYKNIEKYGGSKRKIFVAGHSAGGYLLDMIGLDKRWLAKYGVDPDSLAALVPFSGQCVTHYNIRKQQGIGPLQATIDQYAPLTYIRPDAPPIIIISGDRELELFGRYEEQAYFWRMLKLIGHKDVTLYEMQGYDHGAMPFPAYKILKDHIKRLTEKICN
jgi:hypothetical protein